MIDTQGTLEVTFSMFVTFLNARNVHIFFSFLCVNTKVLRARNRSRRYNQIDNNDGECDTGNNCIPWLSYNDYAIRNKGTAEIITLLINST